MLRFTLPSLVVVVVSLFIVGCSDGWSSPLSVTLYDAGGQTPTGDAASPYCVPGSCPSGQTCLALACFDFLPDDDGDGRNSAIDCDDGDEDIGGPNAVQWCYPNEDCAPEDACRPMQRRCEASNWLCEWDSTCDWSRSAGEACVCAPGELAADLPCGNCGTLDMRCVQNDDGSTDWAYLDKEDKLLIVADWEDACEQMADACTIGDERTGASCGLCNGGLMTQVCMDDCTWEQQAHCEGAEGEVCLPDAVGEELLSCGECALAQRRTRSCTEDCAWDAWTTWGDCELVSGCDPANSPPYLDPNPAPCALCGHSDRTATCDPVSCLYTWGAWGACEEQGPCEGNPEIGTDVGSEPSVCGNCMNGTKTRSRSCQVSCQWGGWGTWGECDDPDPCAPGSTDVAPAVCELCSLPTAKRSHQRDCTGLCQWGDWGTWSACDAQCEPGETARQNCSGTGCAALTEPLECAAASCTWQVAGACEQTDGECIPGNSRPCSLPCTGGAYSGTETCTGTCSWPGCSPPADWCPVVDAYESPADTENYPGGGVETCTNRSHTRRRSCGSTCQWNTWEPWEGWVGGCDPAATEPGVSGCGDASACPTSPSCPVTGLIRAPRTRTCSPACMWGDWGSWGTCTTASFCGATSGIGLACP